MIPAAGACRVGHLMAVVGRHDESREHEDTNGFFGLLILIPKGRTVRDESQAEEVGSDSVGR